MNLLKDKFLIIDRGDNYSVGQVVEINNDYILIRIRTKSDCPVDFYHVYHIGELSCECRECMNSYFFETEAEMQEWITWTEKVVDFNVVSFDTTKKH